MTNDISEAAAPQSLAEDAGGRQRLQGNLGTSKLLITVLAYNAPLGITAGVVPLAIGYGTGLNTPMLYLGLAVAMIVFAVGYSAMSRVIPRAGAFYTFVTAGLGRPAGLSAAFIAIVVYLAALAYILVFMGINMTSLFANWFPGVSIPWWVGSTILAVGIGILGYLRVDASVKVIGVLLVLEVAAVLIYDLVVVGRGGANGHLTGLFSTDPALLTGGGLAIGAIFALSSFAGFETTAIYRDEVRDPKRTVPRATYLAVGIIGVFYAIQAWLMIQGIGAATAVNTIAASAPTAFVNNYVVYFGVVGRDIVTVLLITSGFASLSSVQNVISRYVFNLAGDGVLPKSLGVPHPRFRSPHRASFSLSVLTLVFIIVMVFTRVDAQKLYVGMASSTGYSFVVLLLLAAAGIAAYLLRTRPAGTSVWQNTIAPIISVVIMLAFAITATVNLNMVTQSTALSVVCVVIVVACIVAGVLGALWLRARRPQVYERIGTEH